MILPPKGSSVVRNAPTKRRRAVRWIATKRTPKIAPESVIFWKQLGWLATLLLAAMICTILLIERLAIEEDRSPRFAPLNSADGYGVDGQVTVVDGEVTVVDGEVTVVDSVSRRGSPLAGRR